ncbi:hypothetical protein [Psychroserpens luteolus]|uniref:hypothetical protein n=1 Tax=Psychroserpens luteolus TaxID=2855840 RepID=UPI001E5D7600|nr:hypothetical protein [Psychroserpens luteolus]MCD2259965.1 hypothetical protein [Psychroserpens luteolus]
MPNRNTLTLVFSGLIAAGFFISGILDILDYLIVKAILFAAFVLLAVHLTIIILKDSENKNHLK